MRNQLSESQPGCPGSFDKRQKDRDKRIITAMVTASEKEQADKDLKKDLEERRKSEVESSAVAAGAEVEDCTQDKDYNVGRLRQKEKRKICLSSDRVNVSYKARAMIAASTINAMVVILMIQMSAKLLPGESQGRSGQRLLPKSRTLSSVQPR